MTGARDLAWPETLRNGLAVTFRSLRPDDRERIAKAIRELGPESIYMRLFSHRAELTEAALDRITGVDPERDVALLVTIGAGDNETVIGSGRYMASAATESGRTAEVAFIVEEDYQGLGIAARLLRHLAGIACAEGIVEFEADVLGKNKSMLAVFARSGLPMGKRRDGDVVHVTLSLVADKA